MGQEQLPVFTLQWTPGVKDFERALRAKRRASRVVWLQRLFGGLLALGGLSDLASGQLQALPAALIGVAIATGVLNSAYRRVFLWRRSTSLVPTRTVVSRDGVEDSTSLETTRTSWSAWAARVPLDDMVVLLSTSSGNAKYALLPRRGLGDAAEWPALVDFVAARVPLHPKLRAAAGSGQAEVAEA